jgi:hypothetical protein
MVAGSLIAKCELKYVIHILALSDFPLI